jgi:hypothetical protein
MVDRRVANVDACDGGVGGAGTLRRELKVPDGRKEEVGTVEPRSTLRDIKSLRGGGGW